MLTALALCVPIQVSCAYAETGGTQAPSLQALIDAAPDGGTVTVTSDVTVDKTVTIPAGKTVTLTDDGTPRTITGTVENMLDVKGTLIIAATSDANLTLKGAGLGMDASPDPSASSPDIASVALVSGSLTLNSGTIIAPNIAGYREGGIHVVDGTFAMTGGVVTGDSSVPRGYLYTGSILADGGTVSISGGTITGNAPASSRAVTVNGTVLNMSGGSIANNAGGILATSESSVTFSGGTIANNNAPGIHANSGSSLTMTGGTISGNSANNGGGIRLNDCGAVEISGGTITGNHADSSGGGLYSTAGGQLVHITGCAITNNTCDGLGGGIYINSNTAGAQIDRALVTGNSATIMGGGVWCCPTSTATIDVTDGMAIFGNTAEQAGDDFVNLDQSDSQGAQVTIGNALLGGGLNDFRVDGGVLYNKDGKQFWDQWTADPDAARYTSDDPGNPVTVDGTYVSRALKNLATPEAQAAARTEATTVITGNTAEAGGGLATNGSFTSGTPGWRLTVHKTWADDVAQDTRPASVVVYLVVDGNPIAHVVLSEANGWQDTFTDVPDPASVGSLTLEEGTVAADGTVSTQAPANPAYTFTVGPIVRDQVARTATVEVVNSKPEVPQTTIDIPVSKKWVGGQGDAVTVHLYANGSDTGRALTLNADCQWAGTFSQVPETDDQGAAIAYTVVEDAVDGYTSAVDGSAAQGFTVTNTKTPTPPASTSQSSSTPSQNSPSKVSGTPRTGNDGSLLIGALVLAAAAAGAVALLVRRKNGHAR